MSNNEWDVTISTRQSGEIRRRMIAPDPDEVMAELRRAGDYIPQVGDTIVAMVPVNPRPFASDPPKRKKQGPDDGLGEPVLA